MRTLAILQNQWFKDPPRMEKMLHKPAAEGGFGGDRFHFCRTWLFWSCLTGKRLKAAFGEDACDGERILWEEASAVVSGNPKAAPPADVEHLRRVVTIANPDVIITFGNIAKAGIDELFGRFPVVDLGHPIQRLHAPHPAARGADTCNRLRAVARDWEVLAASFNGRPVLTKGG